MSSAAQVASFGEFCSTLVKEMIFLLDDALGRLTDVKSRQDEMADAAAWNAQPARQKLDRERRLEQVKRTAKGFLDLAKASLSAMLQLTADEAIVLAFTGEPARAHTSTRGRRKPPWVWPARTSGHRSSASYRWNHPGGGIEVRSGFARDLLR